MVAPSVPRTFYLYNDHTQPSETPSSINSTQTQNTAGAAITTTTALDGMGRVHETQTTSDPYGTDLVDTGYDYIGRVQTVSNPYRSNSNGTTTYAYDALDRKISQVDSDGTSTQHWSYSANTVTFKDENGNQWQRTTDGLGRLSSVQEPSTSSQTPSVPTVYTYNALDDLTSVTQTGVSGETAVVRNFNYDSLSRLRSSTNPESGTTTYTYDANGNVSSKADARGAAGTVTFCYDALNRMISKGYSQQTCPMANPDVAYSYDTSSITGSSNDKGRLTSETTFMGGAAWTQRQPYAYNPQGQLLGELQCLPGHCSVAPNTLQYTYDLAGNMTSSTNGVANPGVLLTYAYDCVNRLSAITSSWEDAAQHPATLFSASPGTGPCPSASGSTANYTPDNQLLNAQMAISTGANVAALALNRTYDNRLRPTSETASSLQSTPAVAATATVTISGTEQSSGGSGSAAQATGTISLTYTGGNFMPAPIASIHSPHPLFVGNSITLPDGYHVSFVAPSNSAVAVATAIANVLNSASSPVSAVVSSGGTASAASVVLTSNAAGAGENGPISVSLVMTQVRAAPASLSGGGGSVYDTGTVTANVNGVSATTTYGSSSTAQSVAEGLASAISASSAGVTASAGSGSAITVSATQGGPAANGVAVTLSSVTGQPTFFASPSFAGSSATLGGGMTGSTAGTIYGYTIPASGTSSGYDPVGNLTSFSDCQNSVCQAGSWFASYDDLNRLSSVSSSAGYWSGLGLSWGYDSFGNRKTQALSGTTTGTVPQPQNYSFAGQNRITNYGSSGYDAAGNVSNDQTKQYLYDAEGRLCAVAYYNGMVTAYMQYFYDAEGRRVAKGTNPAYSCTPGSGFVMNTSYVLGQSGEQISELDGAGNFLRSHVYANAALLATYENNVTQFSFSDWLGSKRVVAGPEGGVVGTCTNLPFGDELTCNGVSLGGHHFTGQVHDQESLNDYFGARYYSDFGGRFLSPDYSKTGDDPEPVPSADLENPQSLNLYAYVRNNPLSMTDPDGHAGCPSALQGLCNFFVDLKNDVLHGEFTTDTTGAKIRQLDRQEASDRQMQQMNERMERNPPQVMRDQVFDLGSSALLLGQLGQRTTYLYEKVGPTGQHLKYGITNEPRGRYSASDLKGGRLKILAQGSREDMLKLERDLHSTMPIGPEEGQSSYIDIQAGKGLSTPPYEPLDPLP